MRGLDRIEVGADFLLCAALLFFLDRDGLVPMVLVSCALHELGHWVVIEALGGRVTLLRLSCAGAELRLSHARRPSPGRLLLSALAGPAVNLLLAFAAAGLARIGAGPRLYLFAGLNLGLALFNLLPARWLDGGKILWCGAALLGSERLGERLADVGTAAVCVLLIGAGGALLWQSGGRNFTLLLAALWALVMARRDAAL